MCSRRVRRRCRRRRRRSISASRSSGRPPCARPSSTGRTARYDAVNCLPTRAFGWSVYVETSEKYAPPCRYPEPEVEKAKGGGWTYDCELSFPSVRRVSAYGPWVECQGIRKRQGGEVWNSSTLDLGAPQKAAHRKRGSKSSSHSTTASCFFSSFRLGWRPLKSTTAQTHDAHRR